MGLLDNSKDILPLSSIAEVMSTKVRSLKMYEEKGLLPPKDTKAKKLYSIDDINLIAFVHYLASVQKINSSGIKYILEILHNYMDEESKTKFLNEVEDKLSNLKGEDIKELDSF